MLQAGPGLLPEQTCKDKQSIRVHFQHIFQQAHLHCQRQSSDADLQTGALEIPLATPLPAITGPCCSYLLRSHAC